MVDTSSYSDAGWKTRCGILNDLKLSYEASDNLQYLQTISRSRENNHPNNNIEKRSVIREMFSGLVAFLLK